MKSIRMLRAQAAGKLPADACIYDFRLEYATGLYQGSALEGALGFAVTEDGTVEGVLSLHAIKYPVAGTATGVAVSLLVSFPDDQFISLAGVADGDVANCPDTIEGTGGGPESGSLSTWRAQKTTDPATISNLTE